VTVGTFEGGLDLALRLGDPKVVGHNPFTCLAIAPIPTRYSVGREHGVQRRKLLAVAGALSVTAFATTVGLGANFGLFRIAEPHSSVGRLTTSGPTVPVSVAPAPGPPTTDAGRQADD
jgi:hypothetical protein